MNNGEFYRSQVYGKTTHPDYQAMVTMEETLLMPGAVRRMVKKWFSRRTPCLFCRYDFSTPKQPTPFCFVVGAQAGDVLVSAVCFECVNARKGNFVHPAPEGVQ